MSPPPTTPVRRRRAEWVPWIVLGVTLVGTAIMASLAWLQAKARIEQRFHHLAFQTDAAITNHLDEHLALLRATAAIFSAEKVTLREYHAFVSRLQLEEKYPGIQGLAFAARVPASEREAFVARRRSEGDPTFHIWPDPGNDTAIVITYIEPLDPRNLHALGFDMASEANRRAAMERARDSGHEAATAKVILVQEIEAVKQPGFLIYLPIYSTPSLPQTVEERREALVGFIYAPFRAGDLLNVIREDLDEPELGFDVYDGAPSPDSRLYSTPGADGGRLRETHTLEVAGRTWTVVYRGTHGLESSVGHAFFWPVLIGGILASVLLTLLARAQVNAREAAERSEAQLRESEGRLRRIVESNVLGILIGDFRGRVVEANDTALKLLGCSREELRVGAVNWIDVTPPEHLPRDRNAIEQLLRSGTHVPFEKEFIRKDGSRVSVLVGLAHIGGEEDLSVAFFIDLTERRQAERAHEAERARLMAAQQEALEAAQEAIRIRDEFLSIASHELRTPLTSMRLQTSSVLRSLEKAKSDGADWTKLQPRLQMIDRQVHRLMILIDELLDISRIQSGRFHFHLEEFDLAQLTREIAARFQEQAEKTHTPLTVDATAPVVGQWDPSRVDQVLTNLISNGIKYGGGTLVEIRVEQLDHLCRVTVRDHGIGIAPEDQARIFERFERAVSERHYGGFGLGLWITRQIVQAMGGQIRLESEPGKGALFTVDLPLHREPEA